jgi:hypothetical protein
VHARRIPLLAVAICLLTPSFAAARQSDMYAGFDRCPTSDPAMNEPANLLAACVSGVVSSGSLKVGALESPLGSGLDLQAAIVGGPSGPRLVPGSVSVPGSGFAIPIGPPKVPNVVRPEAHVPPAPSPPPRRHRHRKRHRHKRHGHRQKGHHRHGHRAALSDPSQEIQVAVEPAGEPTVGFAGGIADPLEVLELLASGQIPFEVQVPLKIHITGPGLGTDCYIGSDSAPIVLAPQIVALPSGFHLAPDPNGFLTGVVTVTGIGIEDSSFAVPGAQGCGPEGNFDQVVDNMAGLPAAPGASKLVLNGVSLAVTAAGYLKGPAGGGAELQAAFDAAR